MKTITYNPARVTDIYPTAEAVFLAANFLPEDAALIVKNAEIEQSPIAMARIAEDKAVGAIAVDGGFAMLQIILADCETQDEALELANDIEAALIASGEAPSKWAIIESGNKGCMA